MEKHGFGIGLIGSTLEKPISGVPGQIRIDTVSGLSRFSLPIGIRGLIASPLFIQPTATGSEYEDYRMGVSLFGKD